MTENELPKPTYHIINSDVISWVRGHTWELQNFGGLFHFVFSDWPYNLETVLKRFGSKTAAAATPGKDGSFQRQSKGFMGLSWDGNDLAYLAQTWLALADILHPGGFTASFSHARKFHMLMMAQQEAGYVINPTIDTRTVPATLAWIYGMGKANGTSVQKGFARRNHPLADIWSGYQYGNPLSPEYEPIVIAQKPYDGSPLDSIFKTGAGAYNIAGGKQFQTNDRFSGTVALVHHPGCIRVGYKEIKNSGGSISGKELGEVRRNVYGYMPYRAPYKAKGANGHEVVPDYDCHPDCPIAQSPGVDKAHYFAQIDWIWEVLERLAQVNPYFYESKVSPRERNVGCQNFPKQVRQRANRGGYTNTSAWADTLQENTHPTLKPIKLAQYIATLFLPPPEYYPRRVLVPTAGVGSEMIGCLLAGWDEVIGVELMPQKPGDPDYCAIAEARIEFFMDFIQYGQTDVDVILDTLNKDAISAPEQLSLI